MVTDDTRPTAAVTASTSLLSYFTRLQKILLGRHAAECMTTDPYNGHTMKRTSSSAIADRQRRMVG